MDWKSVLSQSPLFSDVPPSAWERIAASARLRSVQPGDLVFHQGEAAQCAYVMVAGRVRLVQHTAEGKDVTMATFAPGDALGLIMALSGDPYPGSAEALADSQLAVLPGELLRDLMHDHAPFAVRIVDMLSDRLREAHQRIRELSAERVQQRIARSLVRLARRTGLKQADGSIYLDVRLSRQDLAQLNGTTLETVSRTLTAWERDRIIDAGREQITIRDPHKLVLIAEDVGEEI